MPCPNAYINWTNIGVERIGCLWNTNKDDEGVNDLRTYRRLLDARLFW